MGKIVKQINGKLDNTFSMNGKRIFMLFVFVIIASLVYFFVIPELNKGKVSSVTTDNDVTEMINTNDETNMDEMSEEKNEVEMDINDDKFISMDLENTGRTDPFLPSSDSMITTRSTSYNGFSLMAPPENLYDQSDAAKVVSTKVSGILYDESSPSAILNMEGSDYLVKSGDLIKNYKILAINKDVVTVQLGKNIYKAGVGQIINNESPVNYNSVYNLQNRFGGAKK